MTRKNQRNRGKTLEFKSLRCLLPLFLASGTIAACSSDDFDFSEKLTIAMQGHYSAPEGAEGKSEPLYLNFTLLDAQLLHEDGSTIDLFQDDPLSFRIVDRAQIILEVDTADYKGMSFGGIRVVFASQITGSSRSEKNLAATLAQPMVSYTQSFAIKKAAKRRLDILVHWKDTIVPGESDGEAQTLTSPRLSAILDDN